MKSFDLVCFGEVLYDVYETEKRLAGAPLNTASFASFLGLKTALISAIGNQEYDKKVEYELINRKIKPFLQRNGYETGKAKVSLNEDRVPEFSIESNSAFDHIQITQELVDLVRNAEFFYFGTLCQRNQETKNTLRELLSTRNSKTVYDVNLRRGITSWETIVSKSIKFSTILKMNKKEYFKIKKASGFQNIEQLLDKKNVEYVFVTLGEKGALLFQKNGETYFVEAPRVNAVDTTGCGDAFTAALVYGFHKKWSEQRNLKYAVDFASEVTQNVGAFNHEFLLKSRTSIRKD
jgi:fructokinase